MIVHLTQDFIDNKLIVPEGRSKIEFVNNDRSGLYILKTKGKEAANFYLRYKNSDNKTCHFPLGKTDTHSLSEIKAKLIKVKAERSESQIAKPKAYTLKSYFYSVYKSYCMMRNRSWISKERLFKLRIEKEFGDNLLTDITYLQLRNFHSGLKESGLSGASCDHPIKLLSHIYNMCIQEELVNENPAARVKQFREFNEVHNVLTDDQLKSLLSVLEASGTQPALIAMMLISTGCRLNEILTISWKNVDLERKVLKIESKFSKGKTDRHLPLNDAALDVLNKLTTRGKFDHLFINPRTRKPYVSIHKAWKKLVLKAGLPRGYRLHDLRHQAASDMASSGISIYIISKLLGHKNVITSERYSHVSDKALRKASDTVSKTITSALSEASQDG